MTQVVPQKHLLEDELEKDSWFCQRLRAGYENMTIFVPPRLVACDTLPPRDATGGGLGSVIDEMGLAGGDLDRQTRSFPPGARQPL